MVHLHHIHQPTTSLQAIGKAEEPVEQLSNLSRETCWMENGHIDKSDSAKKSLFNGFEKV